MNGTSDPVNPYEGGEVLLDGQSFGPVMSTEQNLKHWLTVSNCDTTEKSATQFLNKEGNEATAVQKTFISPTTNKQVSFVKIMDGGHTIPNRNFRIAIKQMGNLNKDGDAPKLIWDFFIGLK